MNPNFIIVLLLIAVFILAGELAASRKREKETDLKILALEEDNKTLICQKNALERLAASLRTGFEARGAVIDQITRSK